MQQANSIGDRWSIDLERKHSHTRSMYVGRSLFAKIELNIPGDNPARNKHANNVPHPHIAGFKYIS